MDDWLEQFARTNFRRSADTAHDLKTPLNVAVLNLELLRMRVAKLAESSGDEKLVAYAAAIETELRRMARIFDAFFLMSTPPKNEGQPVPVDVAPIVADTAAAVGLDVRMHGSAKVRTHESRIRQALKMFFEGASKILGPRQSEAAVDRTEKQLSLTISGKAPAPDFEVTKIFKFYYTDPQGNPDLSLATARLIAETYGGEVNAVQERDTVTIRLSLPLGD
ncbi:MAG TPA: histidine kinase dimerization/phospho-acceptor domain-containing protein [Thermoanaerobaculia bacterium]|nr:histidine kinase dimerization/phospho-acceptor domain-containing protein [Thermoanaerobaculia bacterium]